MTDTDTHIEPDNDEPDSTASRPGVQTGDSQDSRPIVVSHTPDTACAAAIEAAVRQADARAVATENTHDFVIAVDYWFPVLALLDVELPPPEDWQAALRRCKLRPHTRAVPIVLFGENNNSHPDFSTAAGTVNRKGADAILPRTGFLAQLPQVLDRYLHPPIYYPEGWDEPLTEKAHTGIQEFNRREYYEQHEWLEHAWMEENRPIREMYQGILQIGVALYHIEQGNWAGALKMFRRGLPRLRNLPPICQGLDIGALRTAAEMIHREVTALGRDRLHEFDPSRFPTIRQTAD